MCSSESALTDSACSLLNPCSVAQDAKIISLAEKYQTFTFRTSGRGQQVEVTVVMESSVLLRLSRQIVQYHHMPRCRIWTVFNPTLRLGSILINQRQFYV